MRPFLLISDAAAELYARARGGRRARTVSPSWFRANVLPVFHGSWEETERFMLADDVERRRLDELAAELAGGTFDYPVCVGRDHWWSRRPQVLDGMHRAVTAMRLGVDIPIEYGDPYRDGYGEQDEYLVTVVGADAEPAEIFDRVLCLASFRSADGFWLTCDVGGALDYEIRLQLPRRADRREEIAAELADRLREAGITAAVTFAGEVEFDEDLLPR